MRKEVAGYRERACRRVCRATVRKSVRVRVIEREVVRIGGGGGAEAMLCDEF